MSNDSQFSVDQILLTDIKVINAAIRNEKELTSTDKKSYKRVMTFKFAFSASIPNDQAKVYFKLNLEATNKSDPDLSVSGLFEIAFTFQVNNLKDLINVKSENLEINSNLGISMANIAYSTSRGIVYTRCSGTVFDGAIIPILSNSIIESMLEKNPTVAQY